MSEEKELEFTPTVETEIVETEISEEKKTKIKKEKKNIKIPKPNLTKLKDMAKTVKEAELGKKIKDAALSKKAPGMSLFTMLMLVSIVPLVLAILVISTVSVKVTKSSLKDEAKQTLYIVASNLSSYCNDNHISFATADSYNTYLDSLADQQIEMAILLDGAPAVTSIKNSNGYRVREVPCEKTIQNDLAELQKGYYNESVVIDEKTYFGCFVPIEVDGEVLGIAFAGELAENVLGMANKAVAIYVIIAVILVIAFSAATIFISRKLIDGFKNISTRVNALSEGNLAKQEDKKGVIREINEIVRQTSNTQENLAGTIGKVKDVATGLAGSIAEVTELSNNSAGKAQSITQAVKELADGTVIISENVQDINTELIEIDTCINDITSSVDNLRTGSDGMLASNNDAKSKMTTIMESSQKTVQAVEDIAVQIDETNKSVNEVNDVVELILAIANKTRLLSLNASIEAARAGAAGRGFVVVANEIRNLSDQSSQGAEAIKALANKIIKESGASVELAGKVREQIEKEQDSIQATQKQYEILSDDIQKSAQEIKAISEKTVNLATIKDTVLDNVRNLSAITEENAAMNEEVNANVEVIISEVEAVNENCSTMMAMSDELVESVEYFKE